MARTIQYQPKGVCSRNITITLEDEIIINASVEGGCNGNLKGICNLVKNRNYKDVIQSLEGITCNNKMTSCPDQIARALLESINL